MKTALALLAPAVVAADVSASARWAGIRRRLSYQKIAGYSPGSQVTDHCAIDLDQKAIEEQLAMKTQESFANAEKIYREGAYSKSYAQVTLEGDGLTDNVKKGDRIMGINADGNEVSGKAYDDYDAGTKIIRFQYTTTDLQESYVGCQVGGLLEDKANLNGCLKADGTLTIRDDLSVAYSYTPTTENDNGRTIQKFSTEAREKMRVRSDSCKGCPYKDFGHFYDYYGSDTYADDWIMAAFNGESTKFSNGNADFSTFGMDGRVEAVKKGTAYLSVFMYVIRELEDALDDCTSRCINCNEGSVHAWDEGVCFYSGSIEGQDGASADGRLLHQLADKRCENFKTCGTQGTDLQGMAKLNYDLFDLFALGNHQIANGNCAGARKTTQKIVQKMYVPMVQGTLRYAYKVGRESGGEKERAEGAVFAAAVLPRVHAANPVLAATIYDSMRVGATSTNFADVKLAFEMVYSDMGITCGDVGGLWNEGDDEYYPGAEPCVQTVESYATAGSGGGAAANNTLAIALGCTFGALFALAAAMVLYMRSREKQGEPVFKASEDVEIKDMN